MEKKGRVHPQPLHACLARCAPPFPCRLAHRDGEVALAGAVIAVKQLLEAELGPLEVTVQGLEQVGCRGREELRDRRQLKSAASQGVGEAGVKATVIER